MRPGCALAIAHDLGLALHRREAPLERLHATLALIARRWKSTVRSAIRRFIFFFCFWLGVCSVFDATGVRLRSIPYTPPRSI